MFNYRNVDDHEHTPVRHTMRERFRDYTRRLFHTFRLLVAVLCLKICLM